MRVTWHYRIPEVKIEGLWLSEQIDECIHTLHKTGFNIVAVISDNHSTNVSAFNILIKKCSHTRKYISIINNYRLHEKISAI